MEAEMRVNFLIIVLFAAMLAGCASQVKYAGNTVEVPAWMDSKDVPRLIREIARLEEARAKLEQAKGVNLVNGAKAKHTTDDNAVEMTSAQNTRVNIRGSRSLHPKEPASSSNLRRARVAQLEEIILRAGQKKRKAKSGHKKF